MIPVSPDGKPDTDPPTALSEGAPRTVTFAGTVRDPGGAPAGRATVYVSLYELSPAPAESGPRATVRQTEAGVDGSFRLELPVWEESWSANVVAVRDGCGPGGQRVSSPIDAPELELSLTRLSFIAGRAVDPAGRPITGAAVGIQWAAFPNHEAALLLPEEVRPPALTDADGRFHLAPVPGHCRVSLHVEHPGYARWNDGQPVRSGADDALITLLPGGSIAGRVLAEDHAPVAGVRVRCHGEGSHRPPATTDAEGCFRFDRLTAGTYVLCVEGRDVPSGLAADPRVCALPEGGEARCPDLRMERLPVGVVTGTVSEAATGQPIDQVGITGVWQFEAPGIMPVPVSGPLVFTGVITR